jgi:hypothetical protein
VASIEDILRSIGEPALAFAQQHWMFFLIAGAVGVMAPLGIRAGESSDGPHLREIPSTGEKLPDASRQKVEAPRIRRRIKPAELDEHGNVLERQPQLGDAPGPYELDKAMAAQARAMHQPPEAEIEEVTPDQEGHGADTATTTEGSPTARSRWPDQRDSSIWQAAISAMNNVPSCCRATPVSRPARSRKSEMNHQF